MGGSRGNILNKHNHSAVEFLSESSIVFQNQQNDKNIVNWTPNLHVKNC